VQVPSDFEEDFLHKAMELQSLHEFCNDYGIAIHTSGQYPGVSRIEIYNVHSAMVAQKVILVYSQWYLL
jgi:hypothetical protein